MDRRALVAKRNADEVIERALVADLDALWERAWRGGVFDSALFDAFLPGIIERYGLAFGEVAAQWFEALIGSQATIAAPVGRAAVNSARWVLAPYRDAAAGVAAGVARDRLMASMVRHAKRAGRDTLHLSVRATPGVLYARRLSGAENCDFCVVLASRGPVYGTALKAGEPGNRFHDGCDCDIVPVRGTWVPDGDAPMKMRWEGESPGYDFEKLYVAEYKPYWRQGFTINDVVKRRADTRAAEPWGGITWLEDLKASQAPRPSWWDREARRKTLFGHPGKRPGQWNGGHAYGQNIPGKTEFPARWTDDNIDLVLAETWENPTAVRYDGDRRTVRRVIDGVLVEVSAFDSASGASGLEFRNYHAVGGRGVFFNHRRGGRSQKRIPRLTEEWKVMGNES